MESKERAEDFEELSPSVLLDPVQAASITTDNAIMNILFIFTKSDLFNMI